jgi:putative colanic acid biosynthesis acetyltransferase WcaF
VQNLIFGTWWCPGALRPWMLRLFGATIGENAFIRHRVRVLWPWKLTLGDNTLIGEDVWLLNLESITIGSDVCLSQGAFLCTGSHDHRSSDFAYDNGPIVIEDGVWVAAQALVLRGVTVGTGSVIGARAVVRHHVPAGETVPLNSVY